MRGLTAILFLLIGLGSSGHADETWNMLLPAQGIYEGEAISGGATVPVETRLTALPDGTLTGSYSFFQDGTTYHGTLLRGRATGPTRLVFIWHDDWGFGTLTLDFTPDFSQFVGAWGSLDDGSSTLPWVGVRNDQGD